MIYTIHFEVRTRQLSFRRSSDVAQICPAANVMTVDASRAVSSKCAVSGGDYFTSITISHGLCMYRFLTGYPDLIIKFTSS